MKSSRNLNQNLEYFEILKAEANARGLFQKSLTDPYFPKQAAFVDDHCKLLAGFCTRRAGKSYGIGLKLFNACLSNPGVSCIYIALTRDSAKRIIFKDVFKAIDKRFNLNIHFNHTELSATFPNGSVIYCVGMDSSAKEMAKALGQKFKVAVIDEAGSFRQDLREIVYFILKPAMADLGGQIVMIGTANNITKGLFYDVVWAKSEPGWNVHKWSTLDNPYIERQWKEEIADFEKNNPRVMETPWFKQNYLGEYVIDQSKLVYKFSSQRNIIKASAIPHLSHYVLGIDLGWDDATAFSLLGFTENAKKLYVVHTFAESELNFTQVGEKINWYIKRYNPYKLIIDNANKQGVEEIRSRYQLPLVAAEKVGKRDFIGLMNADWICGNILVSDACDDLAVEYSNLIIDEQSKKWQEHPNCENHRADATLYAWRYCYQYVNELPKAIPTEQERFEKWEEDLFEQTTTTKGDKPWWEK